MYIYLSIFNPLLNSPFIYMMHVSVNLQLTLLPPWNSRHITEFTECNY